MKGISCLKDKNIIQESMIPKIIHYCWFGNNPKPQLIEKCIASWEKKCPDWEIIEWNEHNFDIYCNVFCRQAYENKKWAFVSDYARFYVLNMFGGVYLDTDVEVIKPLDVFLSNKLFAGYETDNWVAPGLILGSIPEHPILKKLLDLYDNISFINEDGSENCKTVGKFFTAVLNDYGFKLNGKYQELEGVAIYPKDFFCPLNDLTGVMKKTKNTHTIHWYSKSWLPTKIRIRTKITRVCHRVFGIQCFDWIKRIRKLKE